MIRSEKTQPRKRALGAWAAPVVLFTGYVIAMVLIAASAFVDWRNARQLEESSVRVTRSLEFMEKLRQTANTVFIAESAQRGFLITGKDKYLTPYREMHERIEPRLSELEKMLSSSPDQRPALDDLTRVLRQRFIQMDETLAVYREQGGAAAAAAVSTDEGAATMLRIREVIRDMLKHESEVLAERRHSASDSYASSQYRSLLATLIVALALSVFYLLMVRYLRQRDEALAVVRDSNADLEQRVRRRTAELSDLSRHLLNVREDEKKNIARDLHDEFGSYLTAINMDVSRARDKIAQTNPEQAAKLDRTIGMLGHTIELKRRLISDLRPSILDNLGLGAALEQYIDEWSQFSGIKATFDYSGDLETSAEGCPIAIFRVFQEALDNVTRHANATEVTAYVHRVGDSIEFEVTDNGVGMLETASSKPGTHGLVGIRERVLAYQGRLEISRASGGGTVLRAWLPCKLKAEDVSLLDEMASYA